MMDDLISRQAVINVLDKNHILGRGDLNEVLDHIVDRLEKLPSVEPEIVRCKDCKYYREYGYVNGKPKFLPKCTFNSIYVNADDFCSRAERKTDEKKNI